MTKMMPGRVRQQGIDMYEKGQLCLEKTEKSYLLFTIDGESFQYHFTETQSSCSCSLFSEKGYCPHLAAIEYFFKNDAKGKEIWLSVEKNQEKQEVIAKKNHAGGVFLDRILPLLWTQEECYQLGVEGSLRAFEQQIDWTLKIRRLPDQRSYIIRDIGAFLRVVQDAGSYQIGKNYYEKLSLEQFDSASQELIVFLWRLLPSKSISDSDILIHFGRHLRLPLASFEEGVALLQRLSSFEFENGFERYQKLWIEPYQGEKGIFQFQVLVHEQTIELIVSEQSFRSLLYGHYLLVEQTLYALTVKQRKLLFWVQTLLVKEEGYRKIQLDFQDQEKLALVLTGLQELGHIQAPKKFQLTSFSPSFSLSWEGDLLVVTTCLDFQGIRVASQEELKNLPFSPHVQELERVFHMLSSLGFVGSFSATQPMKESLEWYHFYKEKLPKLSQLGKVVLSSNLERLVVSESPMISIEHSGTLLDISFDFSSIDAAEISLAVAALLQQEEYYVAKNGSVLVFDETMQQISQTLVQLRVRYGKNGNLQIPSIASYQLSQMIDRQMVASSASFDELVNHLTHPEQWLLPSFPLQTQLRPYQEFGVKWLSMLDHYGFGGILADDMGLGKTLQIIAFLVSKIKTERVLILAPSSLIYNWQEEFRRFAPQIDVAVVYGNKAERTAIVSEQHTVLVTSYASFRQDAEMLHTQGYDYLILDEAQVMKNAHTKIAQQLRAFEVGNCFALSGTPIENKLNEIWSIFQVVLPGLLPAQSEFQKLTSHEVAKKIKPFVLRRKKEEVLTELPDLIEMTLLNELSDQQKVLYLAQLQQMQGRFVGASEQEINQNKIEILAGITRLRQICNSPSLFLEDYEGESGKLNSLRELLMQLKEGGHRVLIFSQFRQMLEVIEGELQQLGLSSYLLTGSTPANLRLQMTEAFNAGSRDVFLISLKAGGVGLNLTGADTVILVDLWWNPAVEEQAISRAYRMGQTQRVECYRLITRGTIEEKILSLQETKKNLVTAVLDGNENKATMTAEEIKEILGIS